MPTDVNHEKRLGSPELRWRFDMEKKLDKHHQDLYEGNGKQEPSITTRIQIVEETSARINASLSKITWLLVTTLLTGLAGIVGGLILRSK